MLTRVWHRFDDLQFSVIPSIFTLMLASVTCLETNQQFIQAGELQKDEITNSLGMTLKLIPTGEFLMGSTPADIEKVPGIDPTFKPENAADELPQHRVRITKPFFLGIHEVTKGQFAAFVKATGYQTDAEKDGQGGWGWNDVEGKSEGRMPKYSWRYTGYPYEDNQPVVNVSWNDATAFCNWLSQKEGKQYRLPTEAEWEYACRAGTTTFFATGDDPELLAQIGNVADATLQAKWSKYPGRHLSHIQASDGIEFTAPGGRFRPNAFGIYDMHGNVWEWCQDYYDEHVYQQRGEITLDPINTSNKDPRHIQRGGDFDSNARFARSGDRSRWPPEERNNSLGFRVALTP